MYNFNQIKQAWVGITGLIPDLRKRKKKKDEIHICVTVEVCV